MKKLRKLLERIFVLVLTFYFLIVRNVFGDTANIYGITTFEDPAEKTIELSFMEKVIEILKILIVPIISLIAFFWGTIIYMKKSKSSKKMKVLIISVIAIIIMVFIIYFISEKSLDIELIMD